MLTVKILLNDTHKENTLSIKTQAPTRSMNMNISLVVTLNQLFARGSYDKKIFKKIDTRQTPFLVTGPFCTLQPLCLNCDF